MTKTPPQQSATRFTRSSRIPSLPPRSRTWIRDSFCLATTGVGICAAAPLFGYSDLPMPASAGFSIAAAYTAVTGKRRQLRDATSTRW